MYIISGASSGLGQYLFNLYISQKKNVIGLYNTTQPSLNFEKFEKVNITCEKEVLSFIERKQDYLSSIVLINCAGANYNAVTHKMSLEVFKKVIDTNLIGTFLLTKSLLPIMRNEGYGRIINISSVVPQLGVPGTAAYSSSKSALWGLTKSIAKENAQKGITINNLNLGYFNTGMIKEIPDNVLESIVNTIPLKRLGDPINVGYAVDFLVNADYITGSSIDINGGLY